MNSKLSLALLASFFSLDASVVSAQGFPNTTQGTPGSLIQGPIAEEMGRTAIIDTLGGYVITIPEIPGSEAGDDFRSRAWDFSDPRNPREVLDLGQTLHGFNAHGTMKRGNQLYLGGNRAVEIDASGNLSRAYWDGPSFHWNRSGMNTPWGAEMWWSYGTIQGNAFISLDGEVTATWDHLGQTGVVGFPMFMGNILIYASDQSLTGVAAYDVSDPSNPVLLDVLNAPQDEGGIGGYWSEISGHYIVFARRNNPTWSGDTPAWAGIQVVDFSDPSNLRLHCNISYPTTGDWTLHPDPMYIGFQDEYAFAERFKVNIETCETTLVLDESLQATVETSQYSRPIGNLLITGGYPVLPGIDGMGVWVHQSEPDTRSPYVAYHVPAANQTNYPVMAPISVSIPETLQSLTISTTETPELGAPTMTLQEVGGDAVRIDYVLAHNGLLTIDPVEYLQANTTYELSLSSDILDVVGNPLEAYSFRFSTGSTIRTGQSGSDSNAGSGSDEGSVVAPAPVEVVADPVEVVVDPVEVVVEPEPEPEPVSPPTLDAVVVTPNGVVEVGDNVSVTASASQSAAETLEYQFELSGQEASWVTSDTASFSFDEAGTYTINVRARNSGGVSNLYRVSIRAADSSQNLAAGRNSGPLYCSADESSVWVVNPDNNSVTGIVKSSLSVNAEFGGVDEPRSVAVSSRGELWVTSKADDSVVVFNDQGDVITRISTGYGSAPYGIVISPDGGTAYASLYGSGQVVRFDTSTRAETGRVDVGPTPRALALTPSGNRLLVARFVSADNWGEVWDIDTGGFTLSRTIRLDKHLVDDSSSEGRGVPNYLSSIIVNGKGNRAYLVAKKDNTDRGLANGIPGFDLDDDNTVRTMAITLDLSAGAELRSERMDFDNTDSPSSLALSLDGSYLYVGLQGTNQVFVVNVNDQDDSLSGLTGQLSVGHAPQGVCVDNDTQRLFVKNFTDRTVSAVDISGSFTGAQIETVSTVSVESLAAGVVDGQRIFYDAANGIDPSAGNNQGLMSAEGYISCATCHVEGGHDGRTYDFTGRGEGIRNNISLRGRSGTRFGNVHWTGNFDEIQDFEHDIRNAFHGRGFMSDADFAETSSLGAAKAGLSVDLDKLAAYVSSLGEESLPRSPYRTDAGAMTAGAQAGEEIFSNLGCASCHSGEGFSDGLHHDVGTLRGYSGNRLGETNTVGLKTPPLLSLFDSAPYMHDGSAKTVADVFTTVGGKVYQAESAAVGNFDMVSHVSGSYSYLREGRGIRLNEEGGYFDITGVDGGSGGDGLVRVRYGSVPTGATIGIWRVGGDYEAPILQLDFMPQVEGADVNFSESSAVVIPLEAGSDNVIRIWVDNVVGGSTFIVDDITVSNADDVASAEAHHVASGLSRADKANLVSYLMQIDQYSDAAASPAPSEASSGSGGLSSGSTDSSASSGGSSASSSDGDEDEDELIGSMGFGFIFLFLALLLRNRYSARS